MLWETPFGRHLAYGAIGLTIPLQLVAIQPPPDGVGSADVHEAQSDASICRTPRRRILSIDHRLRIPFVRYRSPPPVAAGRRRESPCCLINQRLPPPARPCTVAGRRTSSQCRLPPTERTVRAQRLLGSIRGDVAPSFLIHS